MRVTEELQYSDAHAISELEFWKKKLAEHDPEFLFVQKTAAIDAGSPRNNFNTQHFSAGAVLEETLMRLSKGNEGAFFTILVSGLHLLFKRYGAPDPVIFDIPRLKTQEATNVSTIPLVATSTPDMIVRDLLNHINGELRNTYLYDTIPFQVLKEDHFFKTNVFVRHASLHTDLEDKSMYDLCFTIDRNEQRFVLEIKFNESAFDKDFITALAEHYFNILQRFGQTDRRLADIEMLGEEEKTHLLQSGKGSVVQFDHHLLLHQLFEKQAMAIPAHPAVIYNGSSISYSELNEKAERLAHYLAGNAGGQKQRIAVMIDRSEHLLLSILAALKAGGTYVPIDPAIPPERIAFILQDAGVSTLLTTSKYVFDLGYFEGEVFAVDIQLEGLTEPVTVQLAAAAPGDTAYIIYTSGSTGTPKGVAIKHESILNTILWRNAYYNFSAADRFLQIPSVAFDSSVEDIFCALTTGATLVIPEEERRKDVVYLSQLISAHSVTHFLITPSLYNVLLDEPQAQLASLRTVTVAGEATTSKLVDKHFSLAKNVMLVNEYGPTENAVCTTVKELRSGESVNIGKPIDNVLAYILSEDLHLLPAGVAGELYIGGPGLSTGYLNNETLNVSSFKENPFPEGGRLYRSGDICRLLPDGSFEFLGRRDEQVKINGIRIELGEIESVARKYAGVQECKVVYLKEQNSLKGIIRPDRSKEPFLFRLARLCREKKGLLQHCRLLPNRMLVHYKNNAETELTYDEIFVQELYSQHGITLSPSAVVFDIGSNIGLFTLYTAFNYPDASIYAFEPLGPIYESLSVNVYLYDVKAETHNIGFSETEMETDFYYYYNNTASSGMHANKQEDQSTAKKMLRNSKKYSTLNDTQIDELLDEGIKYNKQLCKLDTISNFISRKKITHVDLIKLDVEKSELSVLKGIHKEDWKKIRQVVAEVHDMDDNITVIERLLEENGFEFITEQPAYLKDTNIYYIYARQRSADTGSAEKASRPVFNEPGYFTDFTAYSEGLRNFCAGMLPTHMIPSSFLFTDEFPLTPNGKLDMKTIRKWLEEEKDEQQSSDVPVSPLEKLLADTWTKVIGKEKIGLHDNFFQIGGDSIKAIQIAARMHRAGYKIEVKDIFENLTIAKLASVSVPVTSISDQSAVEGVIPFTPIQIQFFNAGMADPHHFNQAVMLQAEEGFDAGMIRTVFSKLQEHHDALRMVYKRNGNGWIQYNKGTDHPVSLQELQVDDPAEITARAEDIQRSIDLERGPLLKLAIFHTGGADRLLIVIHHMVVDGVSWRILLEDIGTLINQYRNKEELALPLKTDSYRKWADNLQEYAQTDQLRTEAGWWKQQLAAAAGKIAVDKAAEQPDDYCYYNYDRHSFTLDEEATTLLTGKVNYPYTTQINDILLTALGRALKDVFRLEKPLIDLEGHGRENIVPGINIGRTVGWFTSVYPVLLDTGDSSRLSENIIQVKELLRAVPSNGIGYGILKYLSGDTAGLENDAGIAFNYLGQFDQDVSNSGFRAAPESTGTSFSLSSRTKYELSIVGMVAGKKLSMNIMYNRKHFSAEKIDAFGNAYRQWLLNIIDFCCNRNERELTSSDLSVKGISKANIDKISALFGKK